MHAPPSVCTAVPQRSGTHHRCAREKEELQLAALAKLPPLHRAIQRQDLEDCRRELASANPNEAIDRICLDEHRSSMKDAKPLDLACYHGNCAIISLLLDSGADPTSAPSCSFTYVRSRRGFTKRVSVVSGSCLHVAIAMGRPQVVDLLLSRTAANHVVVGTSLLRGRAQRFEHYVTKYSPDNGTHSGCTLHDCPPLHLAIVAAAARDTETDKRERNDNISSLLPFFFTSSDEEKEKKTEEVDSGREAEVLKGEGDVNAVSGSFLTSAGDDGCFHSNVRKQEFKGQITPLVLMFACGLAVSDVRHLRLLLDRCSVSTSSRFDVKSVYQRSTDEEETHEELCDDAEVDELVEEKGVVSAGMTVLHWAVMNRWSEVATLLLKAGADPHIKATCISQENEEDDGEERVGGNAKRESCWRDIDVFELAANLSLPLAIE
ncbi:hypothetical protein QOT17_003470 [Balamuthia mandrillaris]